MGHGKRKMFSDLTFQQVTVEKDEKNIQNHLICQNAACPKTSITEPLDKHYLTHPEGRINDKREEPRILVNMEGDSNSAKQKELFKCILQNYCQSLYCKENSLNNKKSTVHLSANNKKKKTNPKCSCIGKIIHIDTVAQTDGEFQKKDKSTEYFKRKNIYTQHRVKRDADEIGISKQKRKLDTKIKIPESMPKGSSEWLGKRKHIVNFKRDDDEIDIYGQKQKLDTDIEICKSVLPKTSSKWLGKRRRRSRTICIWPRKVKQHDEVGISDNNKRQKQTIALECVREQNFCEIPEKNENRNRSPPKEYKERDDCAKGICANEFNEKKTNLFGKYNKNPVVYTANTRVIPTLNNEARSKSLKDVKKVKSLISCLYCNSKKYMSIKRPTHRKPIYLKLDVCKKGIRVAVIDKTENSCEQVCPKNVFFNNIENNKTPRTGKPLDKKGKERVHTKIKNKKSPKKTNICNCINEIPKGAGDQRKEAILKIDVDPIGGCKVHLDKIEYKTADHSENNKKDSSCICVPNIKKNKPKHIDIYKCFKISPKKAEDQKRRQLTETELAMKKRLYPDEIKNIQTDSRQKYRDKLTCMGPCNVKNKKSKHINICDCFNTIPKHTGDQRGDQLIQIDIETFKKCLNLDTLKNMQTDSRQKYKEKPTCCGSCKTKSKKTKNINICEWINTIPKNAGDRRRDPLVEIKVDATDKRMLNPDIIKNKLTSVSLTNKKVPMCVCPSHYTHLEQYISENLCKGKICAKKFQDNKINFNCKCPHIKEIGKLGGECTDQICGNQVIKKRHSKCSKKCIRSVRMTEPQFEVKLDSKKLCVLNPEEISQKILDKEAEAKESCPGGICEAAICDSNNLFKCKCVQKKPEKITECSQETCVDETAHQVDLLKFWMSKVFNKAAQKCSKHKIKREPSNDLQMKRQPFNKKEMNKIQSMCNFIYERLKRTSEIWNGSEATKKTSCPLSGFQPQKTNYHRRSGLNLPFGKKLRSQPVLASKSSKSSVSSKSQSPSKCGCAKELQRRKARKGKDEEDEFATESKQLRKERLKREKLEQKKRKKQLKEEQREMALLSKQDEAGDETSCFADFILGIFNLGFGITQCILSLLFRIVTEPKVTFRKARRHIKYPKRSFERVKKWASDKWRRQKFYMSKSIKGSRTLTILTDEIKELRYVQAFASKGATVAERKMLEAQQKRRQQRIRKRQTAAVHGCRDILLVTMRRTPCLWVYHVCPDFYPRFLSLRMNFIKICQMFLFCFAVVVWTPCILCCELCRGFICCVTCTQ